MAFSKIKEYLNTDIGAAGELLIPKLILPALVEEAEKKLLDRGLAKWVMGPGQLANHGGTFNVNLVTPRTSVIQEVAEGAEIPLTHKDYETVTFTFVKYGAAVRITREMMEDSQFELLQSNIRTIGARFAENETRLVLNVLEGAANTVSGGAAITIANITTAMQNIEDEDFNPTDIIVGTEVLNDLRNIDTFAEADKWGSSDAAARTGRIGLLYGLNVHLFSPNAAPTTTFKKYAYVLDRSQAYGIAIKRDISVENVMLPTFDMEGAVVTQRLDVRMLRSTAVSNITTS